MWRHELWRHDIPQCGDTITDKYESLWTINMSRVPYYKLFTTYFTFEIANKILFKQIL